MNDGQKTELESFLVQTEGTPPPVFVGRGSRFRWCRCSSPGIFRGPWTFSGRWPRSCILQEPGSSWPRQDTGLMSGRSFFLVLLNLGVEWNVWKLSLVRPPPPAGLWVAITSN